MKLSHIRIWRLSILLTAVFLRLLFITDTPPGLTHDEADHGLSAWQVVQGDRPIYFTVGYGREPLYDYATAGLMSVLGPTDFAQRLTSVFFSLIMLSATYAWVRRAFNDRIALLTLAGLTVNFWALMVARQALRTITLPALFTLAAALWWPKIKNDQLPIVNRQLATDSQQTPKDNYQLPITNYQSTNYQSTNWFQIIPAGFLLGLSFYTYMPARLLWALFPAILLWWALTNRPLFRRHWPSTMVMLAIAVMVGLPLYNYLTTNPSAELRIGQLREPIDAALSGDWSPILANTVAGLQTISIADGGDTAWRYNIAGRPFLSYYLALFFYFGFAVAIWKIIQAFRKGDTAASTPYIFALGWLFIGLAPVLITGPYLSVTRAIGMMPVLLLFPAIAIDAIWRFGLTSGARAQNYGTAATLFVVIIYLMTGFDTAQSYFFTWATHPEVRLQYETTLVTALDYADQNNLPNLTISSPTPDRYHSQPIGLLRLDTPPEQQRWFNGQHSLIIPAAEQATLIFSGISTLHSELERYWPENAQQLTQLPMNENDIDKPVTIYSVDGSAWQETVLVQMQPVDEPVEFDTAVTLIGYSLHNESISDGDTLTLATLWQIQHPIPAETVLFTQLLTPDAPPLTQADRLDVPSNRWQQGDFFIQLHHLPIPADAPAGEYPLILGFYDPTTCPACVRLPATLTNQPIGTFYQLTTISISNE